MDCADLQDIASRRGDGGDLTDGRDRVTGRVSETGRRGTRGFNGRDDPPEMAGLRTNNNMFNIRLLHRRFPKGSPLANVFSPTIRVPSNPTPRAHTIRSRPD